MTPPKSTVPSIGRRERAKAEKTERIMSAAALLFKKQGFDRTTTQQIAETADIGAGTLFLYVQDKSELLLLLYQRALERNILSSLMLLRGKRSFNAEIVQFFQQVLAVYAEDLELSRVFIREVLFHRGRVRLQLDQLTLTVLQALEQRTRLEVEAGHFREDIDVPTIALHIYALYHSALSFSLAECGPAKDPITLFRTLLGTLTAGLSRVEVENRRPAPVAPKRRTRSPIEK
jgi:AcrR family transcriptional regulator